ncbi:omptin family outer membrane protease, partial [Escherichia coli]|uniref:omptin family outer membrane protease n=1 Tax=Escherichia coli TaxID=562 RepID=UPI001F14131E
AEFTIGEGELMAHDVPLGCAPDEYDDLISGTCSHLPYITPEAKVYIEGVWSRLTNKKGDTSLYDRSDNTSEHNNNGAGIENYNFITTAGLKYTF